MDLNKALALVKADTLTFQLFHTADNKLQSSPNEVEIDSDYCLRSNLHLLRALLQAPFLKFLKIVRDNTSLVGLIQTYLARRTRPYLQDLETNLTDGAKRLSKLDHKIFLVFHRLACGFDSSVKALTADIFTLTTPLTTYTPTPSHTASSQHTHALTQQYEAYIQSTELCKWAYVVGVVGLAGEKNRDISAEMLRGMYRFRGTAMLDEIRSMLNSLPAILSEAYASLQTAPDRTVQFLGDVAYTLYVFLFVIGDTDVAKALGLMGTDGLTLTPLGMQLFNTLSFMYEGLVGVCLQDIGTEDKATMQPSLRFLSHVLLHTLFVWVKNAFTAHTLNTGESKVEGPTWLEVFSNPPAEGYGVMKGNNSHSLSNSQGVYVSDFIKMCMGVGEERGVEKGKDVLCGLIGGVFGGVEGEMVHDLVMSLCTDVSYTAKIESIAEENRKVSVELGGKARETEKTASSDNDMATMIDNLQSMFPEKYGRAFLEACLTYYDLSLPRTLDALLAPTPLPPPLQRLSPLLEKVHKNKAALAPSQSGILIGNKTSGKNNKKVADNGGIDVNYKDYMDSRIRENKSFRELQKTILREEEKEADFWKNLQVNNRKDAGKGAADEGEEEEAEAGAVDRGGKGNTRGGAGGRGGSGGRGAVAGAKVDGNGGRGRGPSHSAHVSNPLPSGPSQNQVNHNNKGGGGGGGRGGSAKSGVGGGPSGGRGSGEKTKTGDSSASTEPKPRTKTHDKHHQKDRALRKGAHFANPF
eukprot:gene28689-34637_t